MTRKCLILLTAIFLMILTGCSDSDSPSTANTYNTPEEISQNDVETQPTPEPINENSWDYITTNYPHVTYDEIKTGNYNDQYVILSVVIDNVEYIDVMDWVDCDVWFFSKQSYYSESAYFECDELQDYNPQLLESGDNVDICFYIYSDSSFGGNIKGFSKNEESVDLDFIYNSFKDNCSPLDYESILRNPDDFWGCTFTFSGTVFQVIKQDDSYVDFLLFTGHNNEYIHIYYLYKDNDSRILENDELTIYGTFYKLYDYVSMLGTNHSIPEIAVEFIENATAKK